MLIWDICRRILVFILILPPVNYVAIPQNMKYTETESLKASGFNGYTKFADAGAAALYTKEDILSDFRLTDNALRFTDVHNYIDGLRKELSTTLMWFGLVFQTAGRTFEI